MRPGMAVESQRKPESLDRGIGFRAVPTFAIAKGGGTEALFKSCPQSLQFICALCGSVISTAASSLLCPADTDEDASPVRHRLFLTFVQKVIVGFNRYETLPENALQLAIRPNKPRDGHSPQPGEAASSSGKAL